MPIHIYNKGPTSKKEDYPAGEREYSLCINNNEIAKFTHHRGDGLAECLSKAAKAVIDQDMPISYGKCDPRVKARIEELENALRPFAEFAEGMNGPSPSIWEHAGEGISASLFWNARQALNK